MDQLYLRQFEQLCTQEEPPACQTTCPIHLETRTFLSFMAEGRVRDARKQLDRTMPLSSLVGLLCSGECLAHCRRVEVDNAVNIPLVERACIMASSPGKPFPLPKTGKHILVIGNSLCGLTVAQEVAKKGHEVTVLYTGDTEKPGQELFDEFSSVLEQATVTKAIEEVLAQLKGLKVAFEGQAEPLTFPHMESFVESFQAIFIGADDTRTCHELLQHLPSLMPVDSFTRQTALATVFIAGGDGDSIEGVPLISRVQNAEGQSENPAVQKTVLDKQKISRSHDDTEYVETTKRATRDRREGRTSSVIVRVALGKRAAGSIARLLQGVEPGTARENELVRQTRLYTNTAEFTPAPRVKPENTNSPTDAEGQEEAKRCIQCTCLECVKHCAYLAKYNTYPKKLAREMYNNLAVIKGLRQTNQAINSCTECGLCAAVCPNNVDMGVFCAAAKKEMVLDNRMPPSAHEFALLDMEQSNDAQVAFVRHQPGHTQSAHVFFPGCQLPASLPSETTQVYQHLCTHLEGGVGLFFHCCGAPARWSGRDRLTAQSVDAIVKAWESLGKPEVVVACASCFEFFAIEIPHIPCRSLWDVMEKLPLPIGPFSTTDSQLAGGGMSLRKNSFALHDPCAARERKETQQAVRHILKAQNISFEELPLHGSLTRCCGYGGLAASANPTLGAEFAKVRAEDSPLPLVAYCAMCRERLAAEGKESLHLLEILCGIEDMEVALHRPPLGISERQYGRLEFRESILAMLWGEEEKTLPKDLHITYADGVLERMEKRRIREDDVYMVMEHAHEHGALFKESATRQSLASLRPKQVTFWVRYTHDGENSYVVHDTYCHRMVVPGVPGEGGDTPCSLEGYAVKSVC